MSKGRSRVTQPCKTCLHPASTRLLCAQLGRKWARRHCYMQATMTWLPCGPTCSFSSSLTNSGARTSTRVENCCPILMKVGPSLTSPSRNQVASLALRCAIRSCVMPCGAWMSLLRQWSMSAARVTCRWVQSAICACTIPEKTGSVQGFPQEDHMQCKHLSVHVELRNTV